MGNLDEAVGVYERTPELDPNYTIAHANLGAAWKDQGRVEEAVASFRRTIALAPGVSGLRAKARRSTRPASRARRAACRKGALSEVPQRRQQRKMHVQ